MNALQPAPAGEFIAIVDALYRFGAGQDLGDRGLFESAFAPDAVLDFTQPARLLGADIVPFVGRDVIAESVFAAIGDLDTTHTVTNPRVTAFDGTHAELYALVEAQHLPREDHSRHLLLKHLYVLQLSRQGDTWTIDHMRIDMVWFTGDPTVLFPASP
ncbi:MAG TPA: nuclear transport factor 2 family protein [Rhodanobacteraceae bacterium]|jgi:hypothetical protein|nr:nuclear transport factor 2 family protein [Rhodanobacteraceae bacterium]